MDLICEACGEANAPGTEFCRNCNEFLAWDSATARRQPSSTATSSTAPSTPVVQPTPPAVPVVEQTVPQQGYEQQDQVEPAYADFACPYCSAVNPPSRRFCVHCGYSFYAEYGTDGAVDWSAWTPQAMAARDREAKRAYRRSLPPLYRWRRVIIGVVVFALFVGLGALLRNNPVALTRNAWHRINHAYVTVAGVQVQVEPAEASVGALPQVLVDGTEQEWTMSWAPAGDNPCGAAPQTGTLVFTFPATEVRQVIIAPGLAEKNTARPTQPRPRTVGITFDDGSCQALQLADAPAQQRFAVDSDGPVTRMTLGIGSAYTGGASTALISLTEVWIQTYPAR